MANACPVKLDFLFHQGFTALPGGERDSNDYDDYGYDAAFYSIDDRGYWWSASQDDTNYAWGRAMGSGPNYSSVHRGSYGKDFGFSVRCVRD